MKCLQRAAWCCSVVSVEDPAVQLDTHSIMFVDDGRNSWNGCHVSAVSCVCMRGSVCLVMHGRGRGLPGIKTLPILARIRVKDAPMKGQERCHPCCYNSIVMCYPLTPSCWPLRHCQILISERWQGQRKVSWQYNYRTIFLLHAGLVLTPILVHYVTLDAW